MKPAEFLKQIAESECNTAVEWPVKIAIGKSDAMAARLILWLEEQMPDATQGEFLDVLDSARWWEILFCSMFKAVSDEEKIKESEQGKQA